MKILLSVLLSSLPLLNLLAQDNEEKFTISIIAEDGTPIPYSTCQNLCKENVGFIANEKGEIHMSLDILESNCSYRISSVGYKDTIIIFTKELLKKGAITLHSQAILMSAVQVETDSKRQYKVYGSQLIELQEEKGDLICAGISSFGKVGVLLRLANKKKMMLESFSAYIENAQKGDTLLAEVYVSNDKLTSGKHVNRDDLVPLHYSPFIWILEQNGWNTYSLQSDFPLQGWAVFIFISSKNSESTYRLPLYNKRKVNDLYFAANPNWVESYEYYFIDRPFMTPAFEVEISY